MPRPRTLISSLIVLLLPGVYSQDTSSCTTAFTSCSQVVSSTYNQCISGAQAACTGAFNSATAACNTQFTACLSGNPNANDCFNAVSACFSNASQQQALCQATSIFNAGCPTNQAIGNSQCASTRDQCVGSATCSGVLNDCTQGYTTIYNCCLNQGGTMLACEADRSASSTKCNNGYSAAVAGGCSTTACCDTYFQDQTGVAKNVAIAKQDACLGITVQGRFNKRSGKAMKSRATLRI